MTICFSYHWNSVCLLLCFSSLFSWSGRYSSACAMDLTISHRIHLIHKILPLVNYIRSIGIFLLGRDSCPYCLFFVLTCDIGRYEEQLKVMTNEAQILWYCWAINSMKWRKKLGNHLRKHHHQLFTFATRLSVIFKIIVDRNANFKIDVGKFFQRL